ncbi:cell wall hydrolase [Altererythrobacter sp. CAU 1778]
MTIDRGTLFVDGPAAPAPVQLPERKSRTWLWAIAAMAMIAVAGIVLALVTRAPSPGLSPARSIAAQQERQLAGLSEMTDGEQAEMVETGEDAAARNDRIPFTTLALEKVAAFRQLSASAPAYDNALKCMTQAIYYEAANEPEQGQRAVAQVVLNRMRHPAYPNSVCGVVYEGVHRPVCQFSFTCDGSLLRAPVAGLWQRAERVAKAALAGTVEASVGTATHYHADYVLPRWAFTLAKMNKIGRHIFYRFPGRGGSANALHARWSGSESIPGLDMDRLREELAARDDGDIAAEAEFVPGTTVTAHIADRHSANDVGGRLDTTKEWRLSIPDPVGNSGAYSSALGAQGEDAVINSPAVALVDNKKAATP